MAGQQKRASKGILENMLTRDWPRLARYAQDRRTELGLTQEEVAARGGPSTATIRNIETGVHESYRAKTLRQLADALGWTAESPLAILNGGEPQPRPAAVPAPRPRPGRFQVVPGGRGQFRAHGANVRALDMVSGVLGPDAAELRAVIDAAGPGASGADIFADPVLAGLWDMDPDACSEPHRLMLMSAYLLRRRSEAEAHRVG